MRNGVVMVCARARTSKIDTAKGNKGNEKYALLIVSQVFAVTQCMYIVLYGYSELEQLCGVYTHAHTQHTVPLLSYYTI